MSNDAPSAEDKAKYDAAETWKRYAFVGLQVEILESLGQQRSAAANKLRNRTEPVRAFRHHTIVVAAPQLFRA